MRKLMAVKIEPFCGIETVGELLAFLGVQWCFVALAAMLVWPA